MLSQGWMTLRLESEATGPQVRQHIRRDFTAPMPAVYLQNINMAVSEVNCTWICGAQTSNCYLYSPHPMPRCNRSCSSDLKQSTVHTPGFTTTQCTMLNIHIPNTRCCDRIKQKHVNRISNSRFESQWSTVNIGYSISLQRNAKVTNS